MNSVRSVNSILNVIGIMQFKNQIMTIVLTLCLKLNSIIFHINVFYFRTLPLEGREIFRSLVSPRLESSWPASTPLVYNIYSEKGTINELGKGLIVLQVKFYQYIKYQRFTFGFHVNGVPFKNNFKKEKSALKSQQNILTKSPFKLKFFKCSHEQ